MEPKPKGIKVAENQSGLVFNPSTNILPSDWEGLDGMLKEGLYNRPYARLMTNIYMVSPDAASSYLDMRDYKTFYKEASHTNDITAYCDFKNALGVLFPEEMQKANLDVDWKYLSKNLGMLYKFDGDEKEWKKENGYYYWYWREGCIGTPTENAATGIVKTGKIILPDSPLRIDLGWYDQYTEKEKVDMRELWDKQFENILMERIENLRYPKSGSFIHCTFLPKWEHYAECAADARIILGKTLFGLGADKQAWEGMMEKQKEFRERAIKTNHWNAFFEHSANMAILGAKDIVIKRGEGVKLIRN